MANGDDGVQDDLTEEDKARLAALKKPPPGQPNIAITRTPDPSSLYGDPWTPAPPATGAVPRTRPPAPTTTGQTAAQTAQRLPPPAATPTPSSGGTEQDLKSQWDGFLSRPESRAGLMQFAVNMLSGKGLGESLGGAAAAAGRNVASQEEEQKYEEAQALKEEEEARKERETDYYGIMARKKGGADAYYDKMAARMDADAQRADINEFEKWKADALPDARFYALQKRFPKLKEKADLYDPANREAVDYAKANMFTRSAPTVGRPGGQAPPAAAPPKPPWLKNGSLMDVPGVGPTWYDNDTGRPAVKR